MTKELNLSIAFWAGLIIANIHFVVGSPFNTLIGYVWLIFSTGIFIHSVRRNKNG